MHPFLLRSGAGLVGGYARWIRTQSQGQLVVPAIRFLMQCYKIPLVSRAAGEAFESLCSSPQDLASAFGKHQNVDVGEIIQFCHDTLGKSSWMADSSRTASSRRGGGGREISPRALFYIGLSRLIDASDAASCATNMEKVFLFCFIFYLFPPHTKRNEEKEIDSHEWMFCSSHVCVSINK